VNSSSSPSLAVAYGKSASSFCVSLMPTGQVDRQFGLQLEAYLECVGKSTVSWIDYTTKDIKAELDKIIQTLGFTQISVSTLFSGFLSSYEDYDTELGIMLPAAILKDFDLAVRPIIILIKANLVVTIHDGDIVRLLKFSRYSQTFMKKICDEKPLEQITLILERIIDENNDRNFEYLREIQKSGDTISKNLIEENISKRTIAQDIYGMKHLLIDYLNVLWATKDVLDSLRYGDADLVTDDKRLLDRFGILSNNIDRHIELSEQMSNVLASGLEVMQSIYNNQLQTINNRFALVTAYLTVLGTAFLVPNTIATIAGSGVMHGRMASQWWYWPLLIVSTIISTAGSFLWVVKVWRQKKNNQ
jgi:magnesium transporter